MQPERAYSYILRCADGTFYAGWTSDIAARVKTHNAGNGARYTRGRRPVELVYYEECINKVEACKREWELKKLTRKQKEELISAWQEASED